MQSPRHVLSAGLLLGMGMGMGGLLDGIVLHQLLPVHNILSARLPVNDLLNLKVNMAWDGVFHLATWLLTLPGVGVLWHAAKNRQQPWRDRDVAGALLMGWGLFNFVEGIIDHLVSQLHHVVEELGLSHSDYGFVAGGVLLTAVGWGLTRGGSRPATAG